MTDSDRQTSRGCALHSDLPHRPTGLPLQLQKTATACFTHRTHVLPPHTQHLPWAVCVRPCCHCQGAHAPSAPADHGPAKCAHHTLHAAAVSSGLEACTAPPSTQKPLAAPARARQPLCTRSLCGLMPQRFWISATLAWGAYLHRAQCKGQGGGELLAQQGPASSADDCAAAFAIARPLVLGYILGSAPSPPLPH